MVEVVEEVVAEMVVVEEMVVEVVEEEQVVVVVEEVDAVGEEQQTEHKEKTLSHSLSPRRPAQRGS